MENFDTENIDKLLEICQIRQYFPRQNLYRMVFMFFALFISPKLEQLQ